LLGARVDALRELDAGAKRLEAGRAAPTDHPDSDSPTSESTTDTAAGSP